MQGVTIRHSSQQFRSLLASIEILAAAFVSNALVLGSFVRDRGTKKQRFRFGSTGGHSSLDRSANAPRRIMTARDWGSDADLAGDLGMRLDPELTEKSPEVSRPAPIALPTGDSDAISPMVVDRNWTFPARDSTETKEPDLMASDPTRELQQPSPEEVVSTPRRVSFFDVGGLLGDDDPLRLHSRHHSSAAPQPSSQGSSAASPTVRSQPTSVAVSEPGIRRGSHVLLRDIGGLLSSSPRGTGSRPAPESQHSGLIEALQSTPPNTSHQSTTPPTRKRGTSVRLQDVGGLLS